MSDRELNLSGREKWVKRNLLPHLPSDWRGFEDVDEDRVDWTKSILAQEYVEHGNLRGFWKVAAQLIAYDLLLPLPAQVHGLVLSGYGSIFLGAAALQTPETLAGSTGEQNEEQKIRADAEQSVQTNIGVVAFIIGFLIQVAAVIGAIGPEAIPTNYLQGLVPPLVVGLGIFGGVLWWSRR